MNIIAESDTLLGDRVDFLFYFQPKNEKELLYVFKQNDFDYPVYLDRENRLDQLNGFPSQMEYKCFLLDGNNKVVAIGNPALNPKIWELYKRQITGESRQPAKQNLINKSGYLSRARTYKRK